MYSHLLPTHFLEPDSFYLPPDTAMELPYPDQEWYTEEDPIQHARILRLTRGIHLINEWWQQQDLKIEYPVAENAFYLVQALPELEQAVRELHHRLAPHQKLEERHLVFANGATQIIHAALYANAIYHSAKKSKTGGRAVKASTLYVTELMPGYLEPNTLIQLSNRELLAWIAYEMAETVDSEDLLEFVTTPNNPDGKILEKKTHAAFSIHDRVNHWSLFLNEDDEIVGRETLESDQLSIFSLSKFLSFSGSRVGYAFVKEPQIAHFMKYYVVMTTHGLVRDSQVHCLVALRYLLDHPGRLEEYTSWIREELKKRWKLLRGALAKTELNLLNTQGPNAWIKTPGSAVDYLLKRYKVEATYGNEYGSTLNHARLNLLATTHEFDEFIWRLKNL